MDIINFSYHNINTACKDNMIQRAQRLKAEFVCFTPDYSHAIFIATNKKLFIYDHNGKLLYKRTGTLERVNDEYHFTTENELYRVSDNYVAIQIPTEKVFVIHKCCNFVPIDNGIVYGKGEYSYTLYKIQNVSYSQIPYSAPHGYSNELKDSRVYKGSMHYLYNGLLYNLRVNVSTTTFFNNDAVSKVTEFLKCALEQVFNGKIQPSDLTVYAKMDVQDPFAVAVFKDVVAVISNDHTCEIVPNKTIKSEHSLFYPLKNGVAVVTETNYLDVSYAIDIDDILLMEGR